MGRRAGDRGERLQDRYAAVFPNQGQPQRLVVEEVYRYGREFGFGLGPASETRAAGRHGDDGKQLRPPIVCNGFKDDSYIEAVTLATSSDGPSFRRRELRRPRVESSSTPLLRRAARIGVRVKRSARARAGGAIRPARIQFGLFVTGSSSCSHPQIDDMLDCCSWSLPPGSQLQDIRRVKDAINELAHVYRSSS